MEQHPEQLLLERNVTHDKTRRLIYGVGAGVGGILCLAWIASQEETLAYIGLGKYFMLWGVALAYHVWVGEKLKELEKKN